MGTPQRDRSGRGHLSHEVRMGTPQRERSGRGHLSHEVRMGTPQRERSGIGRGTPQSANQLTDWRRRKMITYEQRWTIPLFQTQYNTQYNIDEHFLTQTITNIILYACTKYPNNEKYNISQFFKYSTISKTICLNSQKYKQYSIQ